MEHKDQAQHDYDGIIEDREQKPPVYFTVLFYSLIIWAVAFSAFYLLSGWSSDAEYQLKMSSYEEKYQAPSEAQAPQPAPAKQPEKVAAAAVTPESAPDAAAIYAQRCAMCHGAEAEGGIGPNLTEDEYHYGKSEEAVTVSITDGRPNGMPAFGNQLKQAEIKALVDHLLSL
jgi:cytochrome c oxidase cbb3-type subunit 3